MIVSCFFLLTNLEYLRVGSFSFSGVVGDPTQAGKNKTHVTFSHGKNTKAQSEVGRIRRTCRELLKRSQTRRHTPLNGAEKRNENSFGSFPILFFLASYSLYTHSRFVLTCSYVRSSLPLGIIIGLALVHVRLKKHLYVNIDRSKGVNCTKKTRERSNEREDNGDNSLYEGITNVFFESFAGSKFSIEVSHLDIP